MDLLRNLIEQKRERWNIAVDCITIKQKSFYRPKHFGFSLLFRFLFYLGRIVFIFRHQS